VGGVEGISAANGKGGEGGIMTLARKRGMKGGRGKSREKRLKTQLRTKLRTKLRCKQRAQQLDPYKDLEIGASSSSYEATFNKGREGNLIVAQNHPTL